MPHVVILYNFIFYCCLTWSCIQTRDFLDHQPAIL